MKEAQGFVKNCFYLLCISAVKSLFFAGESDKEGALESAPMRQI